MRVPLFHRKALIFWVYFNYRQVQVFKTPMCSLKIRYHMEFDRLIRSIGKMICVVKNKTLKHMNMQLSVRYGYSTVAHEPIGSVVRVVMAHRNLARQRYQKWTSPLVARIPLTLVSLPL